VLVVPDPIGALSKVPPTLPGFQCEVVNTIARKLLFVLRLRRKTESLPGDVFLSTVPTPS